MSLSNRDIALIEEGLRLAIAAVMAAVQAHAFTADPALPIDWAQVRITTTPEQALAKARGQVTGNRE